MYSQFMMHGQKSIKLTAKINRMCLTDVILVSCL